MSEGREQVLRICDGVTEALIYFMVFFGVWAFGTTQDWTIQVMQIPGFALGIILLIKWLVRRAGRADSLTGGQADGLTGGPSDRRTVGPSDRLPVLLAGLTVAILAYCLVSALNARATFGRAYIHLEYHDYISWLPHSYHSNASWRAFWTYLSLALSFWAIRDWLVNPSFGRLADRHELSTGARALFPPPRWRRLIWVLCLNGVLLGVEGLVQRIAGTDELLWTVRPLIHPGPQSNFGPYAYRSNGAQYLNLLWPMCVGFWWVLGRAAVGRSDGRTGGRWLDEELPLSVRMRGLLLPAAFFMAACVIASLSRGGLLIALLQLLGSAVLFGLIYRRRRILLAAAAIGVVALVLGWLMEGNNLRTRFQTLTRDGVSGRLTIYQNARKMASDFRWLGSGPQTFGPIYQFYFVSVTEDQWEEHVHNDYLETLVTFGIIGSALIFAALGVVLVGCFYRGSIPTPWPWRAFLCLALAGCLTHAVFDFPFQVHSILFLFLVICAFLSVREGRGAVGR